MIHTDALVVSAVLGARWGVEEWGRFGELLEGVAACLTLIVVLITAYFGFRRYMRQLRLRAADLLLRIEPEHRRILPVCLEMELGSAEMNTLVKHACERRFSPGEDRTKLNDIDRCLRFFHTCMVLIHQGVEEKAIVRAYYFYFLLLAQDSSIEVRTYIATYYPRLANWLERHRQFLEYYKETGEWKPSWLCVYFINRRRKEEGKAVLLRPKYQLA